jgi:hypothetical protein
MEAREGTMGKKAMPHSIAFHAADASLGAVGLIQAGSTTGVAMSH